MLTTGVFPIRQVVICNDTAFPVCFLRKHHPGTACESECSAIANQNTMPSTVMVHYPFHPLVHQHLKVISWPRHNTGATTVQHPDGNTIKIPVWMLQPDAAQFELQSQIELSSKALMSLVDLLASHPSRKVNSGRQPERASETSRDALRQRCGQPGRDDIDG